MKHNEIISSAHPPIDYSIYIPAKAERFLCSATGLILGALVGFTFYESLPVSVFSSVIVSIAANRYYVRLRKGSRKKKLLLQFRDMLESLSASIGAGSNVPNSFAAAEEDMRGRHGPDSLISLELGRINTGISAGLSIEKLLCDLGERSGIEDIRVFSEVFETCYRLGGNIRDVVNMTCRTICDKIDVRQEILTVVSAKKSEQDAMLVMPRHLHHPAQRHGRGRRRYDLGGRHPIDDDRACTVRRRIYGRP